MSILRVLGSHHIPCGCFIGVYEAFDGTIAEIIDAKGGACSVDVHRPGTLLPPVPVVSGKAQGASRRVGS